MFKVLRKVGDLIICGSALVMGGSVMVFAGDYLYSNVQRHFAEKKLIKWENNHFVGPVEFDPYRNYVKYLHSSYKSPDQNTTISFDYDHLKITDQNSIKVLYPNGTTSYFRMIIPTTIDGTSIPDCQVFEESLNPDGTIYIAPTRSKAEWVRAGDFF